MNDQTWQKIQDLRLEHVRLWLLFNSLHDVDTKASRLGHPIMNDYFRKYSAVTEKLLVNLDFGRRYYELVVPGKWTEAELIQAYETMLVNFKQKFPKMEYMEIDNEPDTGGFSFSVANYYKTYSIACSIIARVNARIAAGTLPGPMLKAGGPAVYKFDAAQLRRWIEPFLAAYVADTSVDKRLDFITYHQYLLRDMDGQAVDVYKDRPARLASERSMVDGALSARGLPTGLPLMVTEGGMFAGAQPVPVPSEDFFIKAAGQLAMDYQHLEQAGIVPFRWSADGIDAVKTLFVLEDDASDLRSTGQSRPFYHATHFQSRLPPTRFSSNTDLDENGQGVGSLAGGSSTRVAVLVWNYQWKNTTSKNLSIQLDQLPSDLQQGAARLKISAVRRTQDKGDALVEFDQVIQLPSSSLSFPLSLGPNEFVLIELGLPGSF